MLAYLPTPLAGLAIAKDVRQNTVNPEYNSPKFDKFVY